MKTYQKLLISTLGLCFILGTVAYATDTDTRGTNIALAGSNVQIEAVDTRAEELQTAVASKVSKYDLRNEIPIDVYNQGSSNACWAFSLRTAFETTLKRQSNDNLKISTQHMLYATSNSFTDGEYQYGLTRNAVSDLATKFVGTGYLTNGSGPIAEIEMKFSDQQKNISVSQVDNKTALKKIEGWRLFPMIKKSRTGNQISYTLYGQTTTNAKVEEARNQIKQHLINYGAVATTIRFVETEYSTYYNESENSFYYNGSDAQSHAVTIIGWDDTYSKDKFNIKPVHDGAYLVQNSYGNDKTYFYVSYDDTWIEAECIGITQINIKNYDYIYQHDAQGSTECDTLSNNTFYVASVYTKETSEVEYLNEIALTSWTPANCEIYVNPTNESLSTANLKKVYTSTTPLQPGYTTIRINPIELTGTKFAVVVKYKKANNQAFGVTLMGNNAPYYQNIDTTPGECYFGLNIESLEDIGVGGVKTCIKAFTQKMPRTYNISKTIKISNKNQGQTNNCWTMPLATALETTWTKDTGKEETLSTKHMDYATSQSFTNGKINQYGYNRAVNSAGTTEWGLAYCTNGSGPIFSDAMEFTEEFGRIDMNEVTNKTTMMKVEDWVQFPTINKEITNNEVKYITNSGEEYTKTALQKIRDKIKLHLMNKGAIATKTYISNTNTFYNTRTNAYYCDDATQTVDHGVAIIGWDDDYAKENFNQNHRPTTNGAYIVQNSWGQNGEVASQYYISYEDLNIEKELYGIVSMVEKDNTETIYQYDELGRNTSFSMGTNDVYGANVFTRDNANEQETLKEVAISTYNDMNYEIYVNPNSGDLSSNDMILVAKSDEPIENGYHTIKFEEPVELTGNKFAVAVKYMGTDETLVSMQAKTSTSYSNVTSYAGESFVGDSLDNMEDLKNINALPEGNLCIKAFTNKENTTYTTVQGDANLDGHLTALDISLLKYHLVGLRYLTGYAFDAVDYNNDGMLTATDLTLQMRRIVNL